LDQPKPISLSPVWLGRKVGEGNKGLPNFLALMGGGRTPLLSFFHFRRHRLALAFSLKMRPAAMFKHPTEKRKKPATRVKSSVWWLRIAAPRRHWKIPMGPRPKFDPRTGKKRSKKVIGHENSESRRMSTWKRIRRRLRTAQKTPAG